MLLMNLSFWSPPGEGGSQGGGGDDESSTKTAASFRRRDSPTLMDDDDGESFWSVCSSAPGSQDALDVCDRWMGVLQLEDQKENAPTNATFPKNGGGDHEEEGMAVPQAHDDDKKKKRLVPNAASPMPQNQQPSSPMLQLVQSPTGVRDLYSPDLDLINKPPAIELVSDHQQPTSVSSKDKTNSTTKPSSGGATTTTDDEEKEDGNTTRSLIGDEETSFGEVAAVSHHPKVVMKLHTEIPEIIYLHRHAPRSFVVCKPCTDPENANTEDDAASSSCSVGTELPKIVYVHRHNFLRSFKVCTPCTHQKNMDDNHKKSNDDEDEGGSLRLSNGIPKEIYIRHSLEMKALRRRHHSSGKSVDSLQSSSSLIAVENKEQVDNSDLEAFEHALVDI